MFVNNWMFTLLIPLISVLAIRGSHFDGGSISYKVIRTNGSKLIVRFTQSYTYVYPTVYCNNTYIANQWNLTLSSFGDATAILNCISSCGTSGGYTPIPVASKCTDYSVGMGITVGQRTDDVLLNNRSYFVIAYQGNAFRTLNLPGSGGSSLDWSLSTLINLRMRPDGTYNTPPKATMISPIYIPVGVQQKISIPTIDDDNDNVRCRFASGTDECGQVCPPSSLPSGSSISSDCTLTITGAAAGDWYAVAIQAEDFGNTTSTTPYSSVPVQFLVHVYAPPTCTQRPYLYGPNLDGTCTALHVGVPNTLTLYAENYCSAYNVTIVDIATQSFPIVIKQPIVQNSSTLWSVTLTWIPTANEVGSQVFCSVGIDSQSVQTNQYCLTFFVSNGTQGTCPGAEIMTTEESTTQTSTTTTTSATTTTATAVTTTVTTTTVANTTASKPTNNTSTDPTLAVVTVVLIPICCCCCCCLYCCVRSNLGVHAEERKKRVITYAIKGAYMYKDYSLLIEQYRMNGIDVSNAVPVTALSVVTLHKTSLNRQPISPKSFPPKFNDPDLPTSSVRKNVTILSDASFTPIYRYKMMMPHDSPSLSSSALDNGATVFNPTRNDVQGVQTISYEYYPPSQSSTQINTSHVPAGISSTIYRENIQQPTDPLHVTSLSLPVPATDLNFRADGNFPRSNVRPTSRPWTKHPRWVLRLSQPKQVHTLPLINNHRSSRERSNTQPTSSARSISIIPRYVFSEE